MVNLSRRFKLEYEDANDGTTIIAETGQNTGAPKIERHVHIRKTNDPDILKLWLEDPDYGNTIPTDKSNFANAQNTTDDPEILYKQYDRDSESFVTQGRFYAKNSGTINEEGELAVKLYSFMKYYAKDDVSFSDSTNIESAMNKALPTGYVADVPVSSTNINGTYSSSGRREQAFQELTRNYNYALTFTSELDANNDYKVKFEPVGQGGTVDTLVDKNQTGRFPIIDVDTTNNIFVVVGDKTQELVVDQAIEVDGSTGNDGTYTISSLNYDSTNNETDITVSENVGDSKADGSVIPGGNMKIKNWEKDKTESVVNKVTVKGVNRQTGNSISKTAENTDLQDKVGVKERPPVKIGYLNAATDADAESDALEGAKGFLVPSQGVSELPESGRVKTSVYSDNVVNDSFQVVSNQWNIDDTYNCAQQRNFWPEGSSELEFEFEQEGLERAAQGEEDLRDERSRLLPSSSKNPNGNTGDTAPNTGGQVGETGPRTSGQVGDTGPKTAGMVGRAGPSTFVDDAEDSETFSNGLGTSFTNIASYDANVGSNGAAGVMVYVSAVNSASISGTVSQFIEVGVTQNESEIATLGTNYPTFTYFETNGDAAGNGSFWVPAFIDDGDTIDVNVRATQQSTEAVEFNVTLVFIEKHQHGADPDNTDGATIDVDLHGHDADSDSNDDTVTIDVDFHPHDADTTNSGVTIDVDNHGHDGSQLDVEVAEEDKTNR